MAKTKNNYAKFVTPLGSAVFPHLIRPDTKYDSEGVYRLKLAVQAGEASEFITKLEAIRDAFAAEFKAEFPAKYKAATIAAVYEDELNDEGEETGRVLISAKQKAQITVGDEVYIKTVKLFDSKNQPIKPSSLWSGTKLKAAGVVVPYYMASAKSIGVSLRLAAAQVYDLVEGGGGDGESFGFGESEGGYEAPSFENAGGGDATEAPEDF